MALRLTEILKPQDIKIPLTASTKSEAIAELVKLLADNNEITDAKKVLDAVLEREATRTTGIGNGLAIPHGKCTGTKDLVMAIGKPQSPSTFRRSTADPCRSSGCCPAPPTRPARTSTPWRESAG